MMRDKMKKVLLTIMILLLSIFVSGCGDDDFISEVKESDYAIKDTTKELGDVYDNVFNNTNWMIDEKSKTDKNYKAVTFYGTINILGNEEPFERKFFFDKQSGKWLDGKTLVGGHFCIPLDTATIDRYVMEKYLGLDTTAEEAMLAREIYPNINLKDEQIKKLDRL